MVTHNNAPARPERSIARLALPWLAIGLLLAAVVFAPIPGQTRAIHVLHDTAHGWIFGAVAVLLVVILRGRAAGMTDAGRLVTAFALATALGAAAEVAQLATRRDASWVDVRADAIGAAMGVAALVALGGVRGGRPIGRLVRIGAVLVAVSLAAISNAALATAGAAYARRARDFPTLLSFGGWFDTYFIGPHDAEIETVLLPARWARGDEPSLFVAFGPGDGPGIDAFEPAPDWRGYQTLAIDLTNPTALPLALVLRVGDRREPPEQTPMPFERQVQIPPETRMTLVLPLDEIASVSGPSPRDLRRMGAVIINGAPGSEARRLYLTRIWLQK